MAGSNKHSSRLRRARKDWIKGNRSRAHRIDPDADSVVSGHEKMRPRAITIDELGDIEKLPRGQVTETQSGRYDVRMQATGDLVRCRIKRGASSENEQSTIVVVGDYVRVQPLEGDLGLIHHIEERRTRLGRNATGNIGMEHVLAANVDLLLAVVAADRADFRRTIVDRYIVAALIGEVEPVVIVNKMDTTDNEIEEILREEMAIYEELGYTTLFVSAASGRGMDQLMTRIAGSTSVLCGHSGVGKSSLVNAIIGDEIRRVGEVRERDRRGVHTTVDSTMLPISVGGFLIDTPGIREFGIWDLEPEELDGYFVEFTAFSQTCKYLPCTHTHEPGCAVRAAVEQGIIDAGRYASYVSIFESLQRPGSRT